MSSPSPALVPRGLDSATRREPLQRILGLLLCLLIAAACASLWAVPLAPEWNDAAWYYMNVHFLDTGEYLFEEAYPSFEGASQLYPVLGYSLWLTLAEALDGATGVSFATWVKLGQAGLHLGSMALVMGLMTLLGRPRLARLAGVLFLLYAPLLRYAGFVMSETLATHLALASVYAAARYLVGGRAGWWAVALLLAGYSILVKPVFLLLLPALVGVGLWSVRGQAKRRRQALVLLPLAALAPLAQSLTSHALYGNFAIRSGAGWNLWERVIVTDGLVPRESGALDEARRLFEEQGRRLPLRKSWWVVASRLSHMGHGEAFTAELCGAVARDGIAEQPLAYALGTLRNGWTAARRPPNVRSAYADPRQYRAVIEAFGEDVQRAPLARVLLRQGFAAEGWRGAWLGARQRLAPRLALYTRAVHSALPVACCLLGLLWALLRLVRRRATPRSLLVGLVGLAPILIVLGSNLAEKPLGRFVMPAVPFALLATLTVLGGVGDFFRGRRRAAPIPEVSSSDDGDSGGVPPIA